MCPPQCVKSLPIGEIKSVFHSLCQFEDVCCRPVVPPPPVLFHPPPLLPTTNRSSTRSSSLPWTPAAHCPSPTASGATTRRSSPTAACAPCTSSSSRAASPSPPSPRPPPPPPRPPPAPTPPKRSLSTRPPPLPHPPCPPRSSPLSASQQTPLATHPGLLHARRPPLPAAVGTLVPGRPEHRPCCCPHGRGHCPCHRGRPGVPQVRAQLCPARQRRGRCTERRRGCCTGRRHPGHHRRRRRRHGRDGPAPPEHVGHERAGAAAADDV